MNVTMCRAAHLSDIPSEVMDGYIYFIYEENKIVLDVGAKRVIFQGIDATRTEPETLTLDKG